MRLKFALKFSLDCVFYAILKLIKKKLYTYSKTKFNLNETKPSA